MKFCLVVDDSDIVRKVAGKIVEGMGHIPIEAATAEEALELCMTSMPDMILLDWHLPTMSAQDFLTELKAIKSDVCPQILYCVTEADPSDLKRAYRAGISDFILKPFDRTTLVPKIASMHGTSDV